MIPADIKEWIFPEVAEGADDAAILHHDCGVDFQFRVDSTNGQAFVVTSEHLKSWQVELRQVAAQAGHNCFSYNTLEPDPEGVYFDDDGNALAILFSPATFIEHNPVEGVPILLLIDDESCILTGSKSTVGNELIKKHREHAIATRLVTVDRKWQEWVAYSDDAA